MIPCQEQTQRRRAYWAVLGLSTILFSLEPSFGLVLLALGLSALAAIWTLMLIGLLLVDSLRGVPHDPDQRGG